jgi:hypothetical protein
VAELVSLLLLGDWKFGKVDDKSHDFDAELPDRDAKLAIRVRSSTPSPALTHVASAQKKQNEDLTCILIFHHSNSSKSWTAVTKKSDDVAHNLLSKRRIAILTSLLLLIINMLFPRRPASTLPCCPTISGPQSRRIPVVFSAFPC